MNGTILVNCNSYIGKKIYKHVFFNTTRNFTQYTRYDSDDGNLERALTYISVVIACLGITGNVATIAKILHDTKFHTPTFAAIWVLDTSRFLFNNKFFFT